MTIEKLIAKTERELDALDNIIEMLIEENRHGEAQLAQDFMDNLRFIVHELKKIKQAPR